MATKKKTRGASSRRAKPQTSDDLRRAKGFTLRRKILGDQYDKPYRESDVVKPIHDLAWRVLWGEVWQRPGLTHKERCLLNIGILVALRLPNETKAFIRGAARSGLTFEQIQEALMQTAVYCGFPSAIGACRVAAEVFEEPEVKLMLKRNRTSKR